MANAARTNAEFSTFQVDPEVEQIALEVPSTVTLPEFKPRLLLVTHTTVMIEKHTSNNTKELGVDAHVNVLDIESNVASSTASGSGGDNMESFEDPKGRWAKRLYSWGVEARGTQPVPKEERVDMQFSKLCWVFFSSNFNILGVSVGTLGPVVFQLSVRDSCLVIFFVTLFCAMFPAYQATMGPKLGMRQMIVARYSFGYYGVMIPCLINFVMLIGFATLNSILGGQTLSSVSDGRLSWTVGIVIFVLISLLFSFSGYTYLHRFERFCWIPVLISFVVAFGIGGKHLASPPPPVPPTISSIMGFVGVQAGFAMTWAGSATDYGAYLHHKAPSWKIFGYAFIGISVSTILIQCTGAAFVVAAKSVPAWNAGYEEGNVGGLLNAVLSPAGNFGKFLTVLLSLSVAAGLISLLYSISIGFQVLIPPLTRFPRYLLSIAAIGIVLPLAIVGAHRFYQAITNFMGLIGYWASAFSAIIIIEHLYFRSNNPDNYDIDDWDVPSRLPLGIAALGAGVLTFGLVIPCMGQVLFTGPIAKVTGDIGFEVALVLTGVLYFPFRLLEHRWSGR